MKGNKKSLLKKYFLFNGITPELIKRRAFLKTPTRQTHIAI